MKEPIKKSSNPEMNINRHNFEEFFLLYADSELSAADKQTVEQFVQENPDLANELDLFEQMRLPPEAVIFDDKVPLYKNESTEINLTNYEAKFLLYVDNELDTDTKGKTETFVLQHPSLQETFTLLKQTRLEPETILFLHKQSLFRKEEKEKPVIFLHYMKIAIAAVFIGLAVFVWTLIPKIKSPEQTLAKLTQAKKPADQKNIGVSINKIIDARKVAVTTVTATLSNTVSTLPANNENNTLSKKGSAGNTQNLIAPNEVTALPLELKKTDLAVVNSASSSKTEQPAQGLPEEKAPIAYTDLIVANIHAVDNAIEKNIVKPAVFKELDTEDNKKSLYLGSIEINKDKLRGFFRKAGNLFRNKARQQQEDEKSEINPATNTRSLK